MLDWLCEGIPAYWLIDDNGRPHVNVYALRKALVDTATEHKGKGLKLPSQSTLARGYAGETLSFSDAVIDILSEHFGVPGPLIRGDVDLNSLEAWGMDITIAELRVLNLMRKLQPTQRGAVYDLLHSMLPNEPPLAAPIPPPNVTIFPRSRSSRPTNK